MIERGRVTRIDVTGGVYFTIERLTGPGFEHGPARVNIPAGAVTAAVGMLEAVTGDTGGHTHTVALRPLQAGDHIHVASAGRDADDWIVLGRIG